MASLYLHGFPIVLYAPSKFYVQLPALLTSNWVPLMEPTDFIGCLTGPRSNSSRSLRIALLLSSTPTDAICSINHEDSVAIRNNEVVLYLNIQNVHDIIK